MKRKNIYLNKGSWYDLTKDGRFPAKILPKDKKMYNRIRRIHEKRILKHEVICFREE